MAILKLKPSGKDYIWGGHKLVDNYGKEMTGDRLAETWELSCHPDSPSFRKNNKNKKNSYSAPLLRSLCS